MVSHPSEDVLGLVTVRQIVGGDVLWWGLSHICGGSVKRSDFWDQVFLEISNIMGITITKSPELALLNLFHGQHKVLLYKKLVGYLLIAA